MDDKSREGEAARFLKKHKVPDFYLARALDLLARGEDSKTGRLEFIDYKSLGVRQLGSIYEGLLMYHVVMPREDWEKEYQREGLKVGLVPSNKERKSTGSYFTPQHIVKYIVTQTVGPLLEEKFKAMAPKLRAAQREYHEQKKYEADRNLPSVLRKAEEIVFRKHADLVHELLDVKVLDPAMGSGHFLVETVDFITDKLLDFIAGFPWNPVQVFVNRRVRRPIIDSLETQGVKVNEDRLTDVNLIKRLVMKRCVYGVDLNPMAVELAKVSVWLDSFTIGAPLSFMDHHFRCGNSLIGSSIVDLERLIAADGGLWSIPMEPLRRATKNMELIADLSDVTLTEVHRSAETYHQVLSGIRGYRALLDCITADHFGVSGAASLVTEGGDLDFERWDIATTSLGSKEKAWVTNSERISRSRTFFHWDVDFPDVFFTPSRPEDRRAFDAVIGNPPWGGLWTLGEDESFLTGRYELARRGTDYCQLFTERDSHIIHRQSRCGFVLPSGWQTAVESRAFRVLLDETFALAEFVSLPYDTFEDAYVEACIMVVAATSPQQDPKARLLIYPKRERVTSIDLHDSRWDVLNTTRWIKLDPEGHGWFTFLRASELSVVEKVATSSEPTAAVADVTRGITPFRESLAKTRVAPGHTGELRRYLMFGPFNTPIEYHPGLPEYRPIEVFTGARILLRELINRQFRLQADYADETFVVNKSCQIIRCQRGVSPTAILGCINSAVVSFFLTNTSAIAQRDDFPKIVIDETRRLPVPKRLREAGMSEVKELNRAVSEMGTLARHFGGELTRYRSQIAEQVSATSPMDEWAGASRSDEVDYLGWQGRYPHWRPDDTSAEGGAWYPNGVAPPLDGTHATGIPFDLVARVYPAFKLPGIDETSWEHAAWEEFCELLRKNKPKIGDQRIRADLTGRTALTNPTGPMKRLQETFLKFHRDLRENRAKAAELDFLIDRIVFKLFDLTLEEQKLILSRVGPGRPLPPRRGRARRAAGSTDEGPGLFAS